jgi:hypothetical protein
MYVHTYTLPCEYTGVTRKNAEVTLHRKTYNFEPWTLAYAGTDPTAKPRTPVHAMPSQALLSICTFLCHTSPSPLPPQAGATPPTRAYVQRSTIDSVQVYEDTAVMQPTALYHRGHSTVPLCMSSHN